MTMFPCTLAWCQCGGLAHFQICADIKPKGQTGLRIRSCVYNIYDNICSYVNRESSQKILWDGQCYFIFTAKEIWFNRKSYLLKVPSEQLLLFLFNNIVLLYKNKSSMVMRVRVSWYFFTPLIDKVHAFIRIPRECGSLKQHAMKIQKPQII